MTTTGDDRPPGLDQGHLWRQRTKATPHGRTRAIYGGNRRRPPPTALTRAIYEDN